MWRTRLCSTCPRRRRGSRARWRPRRPRASCASRRTTPGRGGSRSGARSLSRRPSRGRTWSRMRTASGTSGPRS
eukprot:8778809-Pyramimonas_sp.AAC.1